MRPREQITWLYVADLERSRTFYTAALDLRQVLEQSGCCILGLSETAFLGLCQRPPPRETPGLLLCFVTPAVKETYEALIRCGGRSEQAPKINPTYGIEHAFVLDPDGHRVEVQRFLDPDWKGAPESP